MISSISLQSYGFNKNTETAGTIASAKPSPSIFSSETAGSVASTSTTTSTSCSSACSVA